MTTACILTGGPTVRIEGRDWELHPRLGPCPLDRRGNPIDANKVFGIPEAVTAAWTAMYRPQTRNPLKK